MKTDCINRKEDASNSYNYNRRFLGSLHPLYGILLLSI